MKRASLPLAAVLLAFGLVVAALYPGKYPQVMGLPEYSFYLFHILISKLTFIVLLGFSAYGVGGAAFARFLPDFGSLLEEWLFKTALGLVIISYAVFAVSMAGLIYPLTGYVVLAVCLGIGARQNFYLIKRMGGLKPTLTLSVPAVVLGGLSAWFLLRGLSGALLPPTGFDVLMYHLGVPKLYMAAHRMFPTPDINGSAFPFGVEMLYQLGMMVDGAVSANMVNYSFAVLGGLAAAAFARRFAGPRSGLAAFAVYVSVPLVFWLMPQAYSEFALAFYAMLALHALITYLDGGGRKWLITASVLAGFTMAIKYTGGLFVFVLFMGIIIDCVFVAKKGAKDAFATAFLFLVIGVAVSAAWYVRNIFYYGNPVYPFMAGFFNGVTSEGANVTSYSDYWAGGPVAAAYKFISSFWRTTLDGTAFKVGWNSALGPAFLMLVPGFLLFRGYSRGMKALMAFSLSLFVALLFGAQENIRYLMPVLPALAVLAAYPLDRLLEEGRGAARAVAAAILVVFGLSALMANTGREEAYSFPGAGRMAEDGYYSQSMSGYLASYETWKWVDANLPPDAVIYQLWDDASVYFRDRKTLGAPLPWGESGRQIIHIIADYNHFGGFLPGEEIIANLQRAGAGYLLVNTNREGRALPEDPYFQSRVRLLFQDKGVFVFQLVP